MSKYIYDLIEQGEHQQLDFKFAISDSKKIAKTLSAFANTDGGKLLIGVKDNGKVAGVRSEEEYHMIEAAAELYCKPEVTFTSKSWPVNGRTVLEIDIPMHHEKRPVLAKNEDGKWDAYIRVADENFFAANIVRKIWTASANTDGIFLEYTEKEKILLDYIHTNGAISLSKYSRISLLPRRYAEKVLVDLCSLGVLVYKVSEEGTRFHFSRAFNMEEYEQDSNAQQSR